MKKQERMRLVTMVVLVLGIPLTAVLAQDVLQGPSGNPFGALVPFREVRLGACGVAYSLTNTDLLPAVPGNNADYALWVTGVATVPCTAPIAYCTAKLTSAGQLPAIGSTGTPSSVTQDLVVTLSGALPGSTSNVFWGLAPAAIPFAGGLLCVQPPITRGPPSVIGPSGTDAFPVTVLPAMVGQTFFYQWWFRDPGFLPPNAVGLSDGLQVGFCNS